MKIIEAMKMIKALTEKAEDLRKKVAANCANLDIENPQYAEPAKQIAEWMQSHFDTLKEISRLRIAIQRTNLVTPVTLTLDGKNITKTIAEWIHRKRDLASLDMTMWAQLNDRGLKDAQMPSTSGGEPRIIRVVRHFEPKKRDAVVAALRSEPHVIDSTLEVVNATTEIVTE